MAHLKTCSICKLDLPIEVFRYAQCRGCRTKAEAHRRQDPAYRELLKEASRRYYQSHKEEIAAIRHDAYDPAKAHQIYLKKRTLNPRAPRPPKELRPPKPVKIQTPKPIKVPKMVDPLNVTEWNEQWNEMKSRMGL